MTTFWKKKKVRQNFPNPRKRINIMIAFSNLMISLGMFENITLFCVYEKKSIKKRMWLNDSYIAISSSCFLQEMQRAAMTSLLKIIFQFNFLNSLLLCLFLLNIIAYLCNFIFFLTKSTSKQIHFKHNCFPYANIYHY